MKKNIILLILLHLTIWEYQCYAKGRYKLISQFSAGGYGPILEAKDYDNDGYVEIKLGEAYWEKNSDKKPDKYKIKIFHWSKNHYEVIKSYIVNKSNEKPSYYGKNAINYIEIDDNLKKFVPTGFLIQGIEKFNLDLDKEKETIFICGFLENSEFKLFSSFYLFILKQNNESYQTVFVDKVPGSRYGLMEEKDINKDGFPELLIWTIDPGGSGYTINLMIYAFEKEV